jgi:hypothetical protein
MKELKDVIAFVSAWWTYNHPGNYFHQSRLSGLSHAIKHINRSTHPINIKRIKVMEDQRVD